MSTEPHQDTTGDATSAGSSAHLDFTEGSTRSGDGPVVVEVVSTGPTENTPTVDPTVGNPTATTGSPIEAVAVEAGPEASRRSDRPQRLLRAWQRRRGLAPEARADRSEHRHDHEVHAAPEGGRMDPTAGTGSPTSSPEATESAHPAESPEPAELADSAARLPPPPLPVPRSSRSRRFGALLLDLLLVATTMFVGWFVWSLRTWARGQTPAMSFLGMRCVRVETAKAANWPTMVLRELIGKGLLSAVTLGITAVVSAVTIVGPTRQGLWDRMAGTTVVDDPDGLTRPRSGELVP
jgi:uncharacterized RDD family membrane protein YckC